MHGPIHATAWETLLARAGTQIGVSDWIGITQVKIDAFAELTDDHFFIHVDPQRAAALPFGGTVAHGFLTLSLLSKMSYQVCPVVEGMRYALNYGFNRIRFVARVPVNSRVRTVRAARSGSHLGRTAADDLRRDGRNRRQRAAGAYCRMDHAGGDVGGSLSAQDA